MKIHEIMFESGLLLSYILYIVAFLRIGTHNPQYLDLLQVYMKYYVTIFLLIRFNPFVKSQFTDFDRKVVFSSAIFLLTTTTFTQYANKFDILELVKTLKFTR